MSGVAIGKDASDNTIIAGNENKVEVHHHHYLQTSPALSPQTPTPDSLKIDLSSLPTTSPDLFGRSREIEMLDRCWDSPKTNIAVLVAWGGVGKTSLVNHWLASMAQNDFRGADRVFGWSFYSQGAAEGKQASADRFIADALRWFDDPDPNQGDFADKAKRLSALIKKHRTLLILDGLEPLQAPPGPEEGRLRDQSLRILLRDLAVGQKGLCVITTRLWTDDLSTWRGKGVERTDLSHLASEDGAALLKHLGVNGTEKELRKASVGFDGHALALTLLGTYLVAAYDGDVRQRDKVDCLMYEDMPQGKHARCVMESYQAWMLSTEKGRRELNILRMMGLFDRPAESGAIKALLTEPAIPGLTDELHNISPVQWQFAVKQLRDLRLLSEKDKDRPDSLDCHPLIREHFGEKLRKENPVTWKEAHSRLYEYYKNLPEKEFPDTLEEMEPLFAAVAHGCKAGRHQEAFDDVYWARISRIEETYEDAYISKNFGSFGTNLSVLSNFFEILWTTPAQGLYDSSKAQILNLSGYSMRALGRMWEAIQSMRLSMEENVKQDNWKGAWIDALNLSEFWLTCGNITTSVSCAIQSIEFAVKDRDWIGKREGQTTLADVLHQSGNIAESERFFQESEDLQKEKEPAYFYLYSFSGIEYCDLLLSIGSYKDILERVIKTQEWKEKYVGLIDIALNNLILGKAFLIQAQEQKSNDFIEAEKYLNQAIEGLLKAGYQDYLARGLLARAALFRLKKEFPKAHADLDEAFEIADRSGMRLYLTDYHLESSRLCLAEGNKIKAKKHLASAKKLIAETGYHRRDEEAEELGRLLNQD